jgi:hypothetical protein
MLLILAVDRVAAIRHTPCGVGRVRVGLITIGLIANGRRLRRLDGGEKADGEFVD